MTRALPTVDMQNLAGDKPSALQIDDRLGDVTHLPHMPDRMQLPERRVGFFAVHRRLDDPWAHRVHPDATLGVLDRQGLGR